MKSMSRVVCTGQLICSICACMSMALHRVSTHTLLDVLREKALSRSIVPQHRDGGATLIVQTTDKLPDVVDLLSPLRYKGQCTIT